SRRIWVGIGEFVSSDGKRASLRGAAPVGVGGILDMECEALVYLVDSVGTEMSETADDHRLVLLRRSSRAVVCCEFRKLGADKGDRVAATSATHTARSRPRWSSSSSMSCTECSIA